MKVTVKLKSADTPKLFEKVWEIQSNLMSDGKEIIFVGYDHIVHFREKAVDIESFITELE